MHRHGRFIQTRVRGDAAAGQYKYSLWAVGAAGDFELEDPERLTLGPVTIEFGALQATRDATPLQLTNREFAMSQYLSERPHKVVHREDLLREVWGYPEAPDTRSVDHAIAGLRKKIEIDPHRPHYIQTVHGDGYC